MGKEGEERSNERIKERNEKKVNKKRGKRGRNKEKCEPQKQRGARD
jgi:hypothetical protein